MTSKPNKGAKKAKKDADKAVKAAAKAGEDRHEKVPEAAENMEHTLRRLNAEKEKKRAQNPGLYL
ncbi:hypothetical protein [Tropicimonas sediminicola]|uniref:Uncharacterized protein n=1 Tax=Tropicimonas sediminicola TaxID=1031541 RepID=A0A239CFP2_9RHOB|nr:hypothetical protein [Tropicimonas sediminicola]SNS18143.1 hypothetical protein SAMN05421757_101226 [Tropicimonas sediminicola]